MARDITIPAWLGPGGALVALGTVSALLVPAVAGASTLASRAPALSAAPTPTLSCAEWQTTTVVPVVPSTPVRTTTIGSGPRAVVTTLPAVPAKTRPMCRKAPPTPFAAPHYEPDSVVGGPRLAEAGLVADLPSGIAPPPTVPDVSYVIADLDSGEILAAKAPHAWLRPASTLKTLTALTFLPLVKPNQQIEATEEHVTANGTRVGMVLGNKYSAGNLFEALLMFSANDAAYGLTAAVGGYDKGVALMNDKAKEIGAYDTIVVDPSGLDEGNQRSSAYDLALIGRDAMKLPAFRSYIVKRESTFPGGVDPTTKTSYPAFQIYNINEFLNRYPGAIGIKPGRTDRAQHTFIGAATREGRSYIVTQMGSTTGSWKDTAALLDWAFANGRTVHPVGHLVEPGSATPPRVAPTPVPAVSTADITTPGGTPTSAAPTAAAPAATGADQSATNAIGTRAAAARGDATPLLAGGAAAGVVAIGVVAWLLRRRRASKGGFQA